MKKIIFMLLLVLLLSACNDTSNTNESQVLDSETEEKDPKTIENNYISAAVEFSKEAENTTKNLEGLLQNLDNVENSGWKNEVNSELNNLTMERNDYVTPESFLSDEQSEKYDSTLKHYANASSLIREIYDEGYNSVQTDDKKALEEIRNKLPELIDALIKGKEQLEIERYE